MFKNAHIKKELVLYFLLFTLNVLIRIPSIPHEKGSDSFFVHSVANSISTFGYATWWTHWLSIFGSYHPSVNSGLPFLLSSISQLTLFNMEYSILLYCLLFGMFSLFTSYLLASVVFEDWISRYIFTFVFSLCQGVLIFTTWEASSRGAFIVFFPLFIYFVLKFVVGKPLISFFLLVMLTIFMFSLHSFAYIAVYLSFAITIIHYLDYKINLSYTQNIMLYFVSLIGFILFPFFTGTFISTSSRYEAFLQIFVFQARYIGPLIIFSVGGFVYLATSKSLSKNMKSILLVSITLVPILYSQIYGHYVYLIFFAFFITISISNLLSTNSKKLRLFVIFFLILFVVFSGFYNHWRTGSSQENWFMSEQIYSSASWAEKKIDFSSVGIANGEILSRRFMAISNSHPRVITDSVSAFIYGITNVSDNPVSKQSPTSLRFYFDGPYVATPGYSMLGKINWILGQNDIGYPGSRDIFAKYNISYLIIDNDVYVNVYPSLESKKSNLYDNGQIEIWTL